MRFFLRARIIALVCIVAAGISLVLWIRGGTGEDTWICVEGQWIKHGNPAAPAPLTPCRTVEPTTDPQSPRQSSPSVQSMKIFESAEFSIRYPDWSPMDQKSIREPKRTVVAVRNAGCALIVTINTLPPDQDFQSSLEQLLSEQVAQTDARVLSKNISATQSHVKAEFPIAEKILRTDQYGYLAGGRTFYSVVFAAERSVFDSSCAPVIDRTVKSVEIK